MKMILLLVLCFICTQAKPNFLFLQCDSMDGRVLSPFNRESLPIYAPNLHHLISTGVNFASTYTASPQCVPSRTSMWTGLRVDQTGSWNNDQGFCNTYINYTCVDQNTTGIYTLWDTPLKEVGYDVAILGRVDMGGGYGGGFHGVNSGLTAWTRSANILLPSQKGPLLINNSRDPYPGDSRNINECIQYLKRNVSDQPFFLHCGTLIPHPGYDTNETWLELIKTDEIFAPTWLDYETMHPYDKYMITSKCTYTRDCQGLNATQQKILNTRALYYAAIAQTDHLFGQVLQTLRDIGKYNDTIIVFTSDHGELNMDHRQWLKNSMYEGSSRVPLVFSGPGILQNITVAQHTSLLDIFPTLMDLSGATGPNGLQGDSLAPFLQNPNPPSGTHKDYILSQYHSNFGNTGSFMLRQGDWKYIAFGTNPPFQDYKPQLFNVTADPEELIDISLANPTVVQTLDALLNSVIDYKAVDALVKKQDYQFYMSWQYDGHEQDYVQECWDKIYIGFDGDYQKQAQGWIDNGPFYTSH